MKKTTLKSDAGFSMVELIVVTVVAGIMLGAATMMINTSDQNSNQGKALHRLLSDARFAQETAVGQNRSVDFSVNTSSNSYSATYTGTSTFITSPISGDNLYVLMNSGDYGNVSITSTGLSGVLTFNRVGEPLIGTVNIQSTLAIATLTGGRSVMINPAGYTYIQ
jgi:prepilin-type N-terminal cleavage/methylation domain-containing protein